MAAAELDRKFPMLELPKLSCFESNLEEKPPDPMEVLKEMAAQHREKERRLFVKRIRRMYHLSQSNTASAQRIFDEHGEDFKLATDGPDLEQLVGWH